LGGHLTLGEPAGELDQPVSERGLAVINMRYDRKIADLGKVSHYRRDLALQCGKVIREKRNSRAAAKALYSTRAPGA
jgi:hypothetical protein